MRTLKHDVTLFENRLAFSPDGQALFSVSNNGVKGTINIWNPDDGNLIQTFHGSAAQIIAASSDGKTVALAYYFKIVLCPNPFKGKLSLKDCAANILPPNFN